MRGISSCVTSFPFVDADLPTVEFLLPQDFELQREFRVVHVVTAAHAVHFPSRYVGACMRKLKSTTMAAWPVPIHPTEKMIAHQKVILQFNSASLIIALKARVQLIFEWFVHLQSLRT